MTIRSTQLSQQKTDTIDEAIAYRLACRRAGELAIAERLEEFPILNGTNAGAAMMFQEHRQILHTARLVKEAIAHRERRAGNPRAEALRETLETLHASPATPPDVSAAILAALKDDDKLDDAERRAGGLDVTQS